jgi:hypothetical protein
VTRPSRGPPIGAIAQAADWAELTTGFTPQLDRGTALYASASYDVDLEGDGEAWDGRIGLKVAW